MDWQEFRVGVKAIFLNAKKEILILNKSPKHGNAKLGAYWDIPGGGIIKGANIEGTLKKEVEEELGIKDFVVVKLFDACISKLNPHGEKGLFLVSYLCKLDPDSRITLDSEHTEYRWVDIREAKSLLVAKFPESFLERLDELASED